MLTFWPWLCLIIFGKTVQNQNYKYKKKNRIQNSHANNNHVSLIWFNFYLLTRFVSLFAKNILLPSSVESDLNERIDGDLWTNLTNANSIFRCSPADITQADGVANRTPCQHPCRYRPSASSCLWPIASRHQGNFASSSTRDGLFIRNRLKTIEWISLKMCF